MRIAVTLPMSGPQTSLGRDIRAAIEMALEDTRSSRGVDAPPIELSWHDDRCSSEGGRAAASQIVADPTALPVAVLGHACPSAAQAAAALYDAAGIAFLVAGSLPARVPMSRRFGLRHFRLPADGTQSALIGTTLLDAGPDARIAFVRDRTQYATLALQAVSAVLTARRRSVVLVETFAGAEKDFAALAQRIKAAHISHIALAAFPSEAVLLVAEVRKVNPSIEILATDQLADPEFARPSATAAEGVKVALPPDFRALPRAREVARRLEAAGAAATRTALASHAALEVLVAAVAADRSRMQQALETTTFDTILGPVRFDANGAANVPSHVFYIWTDGKLSVPPQ